MKLSKTFWDATGLFCIGRNYIPRLQVYRTDYNFNSFMIWMGRLVNLAACICFFVYIMINFPKLGAADAWYYAAYIITLALYAAIIPFILFKLLVRSK